MKAIQLVDFKGVDSLAYVDVPTPKPAPGEVLIKVKAAGINYAEVEQIQGKYLTFGKDLPFTMGFEVAGIITEIGQNVLEIKIGDRVTAMAISGGFAEYATASADALIPIPGNMSFADATTIPLQGMTAYTLLKYNVIPYMSESILIQAAAGGVGLYLVQLAKYFGIKKIIALSGSDDKLELTKDLGAHFAINYTKPGWASEVLKITDGKGVDVVLQMSVGEVGQESFKLIANGGRIIVFGSKNYHDIITTEQIRQLIWQNQTLAGFAFPALSPEKNRESLSEFLKIIKSNKIRIFANHPYSLTQAKEAFLALQGRTTIGKVYFNIN